jgi:alpha-beta hydrolase superfamily lysophospholipase
MKVTLDDAAQYVAGQILGLEGDVVLAAHSSGGLVVPGVVAHAAGRVRHVVLNAASVPPRAGPESTAWARNTGTACCSSSS